MRENDIFLTPVKYTLVCCTPKFSWFLGLHDTLPCVLIGIMDVWDSLLQNITKNQLNISSKQDW